jgi:hypothetical protein
MRCHWRISRQMRGLGSRPSRTKTQAEPSFSIQKMAMSALSHPWPPVTGAANPLIDSVTGLRPLNEAAACCRDLLERRDHILVGGDSHRIGNLLVLLLELAGRHKARFAAGSSSFGANPTQTGQLSDNTVSSNTALSGDIPITARSPVPRGACAGAQSSTAKPATTSKAARI